MNTEQLILKKVKHAQINKQLMFDVASLNEHFDGLLIHATDVLVVEEGEFVKEYIKHSDVNFDSATANEVSEEVETVSEPQIEVVVTDETLNDNPELVNELIVVGDVITVDEVEAPKVEDAPELKKKKSTSKKQ